MDASAGSFGLAADHQGAQTESSATKGTADPAGNDTGLPVRPGRTRTLISLFA
ncbi:hypothetical protein [Halostella sp. PRR32]|uniref:hypothetical protein n=1 Tax=Halostella sp. PRR32 TaxID=3098147 RepID=UPI002B1CFBA7|nr:hypothetical protein [Halostella sp. PRR32]